MEEIKELLTNLRLDDITVERKAVLYPEALRDPYLWLARYARGECAADIDVLKSRFATVGVYRDKQTWIKILKGQWNHHPNGTERDNPVVALDKLLEEIEALRTGARVEEARGRVPFVMTTVAASIFSFIKRKMLPERVNKFGVIIGPTGSQKTATFREFCRQHNHGQTNWLEAPENKSMGEFVTKLARLFGGPAQEPYDRRRQRIFASLNEKRVVIVDNCQRLYREERGAEQPLFGFLQRVQDETGCAIILSVTPAFEGTLTAGMMSGFFEQFEGRAGGRRNFLRLPMQAPTEDVMMIARAFGLRDAARYEKLLTTIAHKPGRIRILFEVLQDAKILAESEKKPLTIDFIREVWEEEAA